MTFDPGNRLIVAVDVPGLPAAEALANTLGGAASWLKVGLELFCATGPDIVDRMRQTGARVMLDLKLHDIPHTVARATAQVASLGAELVTVHTGGGPAMLRAAVEAARSGSGDTETRVLGVTVLTSMDQTDLQAVGVPGAPRDIVLQRAKLAIESGCHGVVASPHEAAAVRAIAPDGFLVVTPGVRPAGADVGDQKRVMTPSEARAAGADLVVVGRPVRDADDPSDAARAIAAELAQG